MLHVDTGTVGEYEFGTVEGADAPVVTRGVLATMPIWTVPHMRVENQAVLRGDGQGDPNTSLFAESVLAEVDGFLVIHSDQGGQPGPVAGFVRVERGLTTDVTVEGLDPTRLTPRLWPMLHVDTGTIGEYEFGVVEGADAPVQVGGNVLTFPINGAPSLTLHNQDPLPGEATGTLRFVVDEALMDSAGWLAIHNNNNGSPGPVLTVAKLHPGSNKRIIIEVNAADAGDLVFPMLHYDTGVVGTYEFGAVEGADVPVSVGGQIVVAPQRLTTASGEPTAVPTSDQAATGACTVSSANTVNRRSTASTNANVVGQMTPGQSVAVIAQTAPIGGFVWYQLDDQSFVRADVVTTSGDCASVPTVIPPDAPPPVQPPAATQEPSG
jgi:hypothetical protein